MSGVRTLAGIVCVLALATAAPLEARNLTVADVRRIAGQAEQAAQTLGQSRYTVAVVDRVGNVLGVYRRGGASVVTLASGLPVRGGLEKISSSATGLDLAALAAIAKAVTGAYLSSSGNAFSTRTAGYIIQNHFAPGVRFTPGGPLFGVQFSQLPCGDVVQTRNPGARTTIGPRRSPLGLAADPGGFPLYKRGQVVGGVGIVAGARSTYGLDLNPRRPRADLEERIALAAATGYRAAPAIRADRITVAGLRLPYSSSDRQIPRVSRRTPLRAKPIAVAGYTTARPKSGRIIGRIGSGLIRANARNASTALARRGAFILENGRGANRYPARSAAASTGLSRAVVNEILQQALGVANQTRTQIRNPRNARAQVSVTVVDANGRILGLARSADAPLFGIDVAVQKARTATFFSRPDSAARLNRVPAHGIAGIRIPGGAGRVNATRQLLGNVLNGTAFSTRSIGNLARPNFPDGIDGRRPGPLSNGSTWSPFNVGLQLDLVQQRVLRSAISPTRPLRSCTIRPLGLDNGMQIFPGGMPIYRGNRVVGAIGVSGDGVDQDDMVAFLGLQRASRSAVVRGRIGHAPPQRRADQAGLRYVQCPQSPFVSSNQQRVCDGI
ncbi:MAG: heme-binding protein [Gammaproteobacteria bacterium]